MKGLNRVTLFGSVIGLASLLSDWLAFKPNRIASGEGVSIWETDVVWAALLAGLWLSCIALSLRPLSQRSSLVLGGLVNTIFVITFSLAGSTAARLLEGAEAVNRVSFSGGVWLALVAVYIIIFATSRNLKGVGRAFLQLPGLAIFVVLLLSGWFDHISLMQEYAANTDRFSQEFLHHIFLFGTSVLAGTLLAVPLGIWAASSRRVEKPVFAVTNIAQTIPSLALFGLLMAPLSTLSFNFPWLRDLGISGIGNAPALIALTIYSLLPIARNTYAGLKQIDPAVVDSGKGMGMNRGQIFRRLKVPLAAPLVLEGVRNASVAAVGNTAVAALIGAGGLGFFIFRGLGQAAPDLILLGALPTVLLALGVDAIMRLVVRLSTPKGIKVPA